MLLTITTTHKPATDLGYLLYKNPDTVQSADLSFGTVHVFYPEATENKCTVALLLDVDPVGLIRNRKTQNFDGPQLEQYVNDRPYVASSFMSVALNEMFRTAIAGKSKERPELANTAIALEAFIPCLPCRGGEKVLRGLFEPLGYEAEIVVLPLDPKFPEWGNSRYFSLRLKATCKLSSLLSHLYVLIPVLDDNKHYWVGEDEIEKLLRAGKDWLASHPQKDLITKRYLRHRKRLAHQALAQLSEENTQDPDEAEEKHCAEEAVLESKISLNEQRMNKVISILKELEASSVIDLGCGEGKLLNIFWNQSHLRQIVGMDVSHRSLDNAFDRLHLEYAPEAKKKRLRLIHGSLTYKDSRLSGFDAATCIEVVEHLDASRLTAFERVIFEYARPKHVILTTPNIEYNVKFEKLPAGKLRHKDHRFEWTRAQFEQWCQAVATKNGYTVRFEPVGEEDEQVGPPTQMGIFSL